MKNDLTLLCVEDDEEALENIVYLLKRDFSYIYSATNGEEALDIYNEKKPDIILLDINIPKINGLRVAANIRKTDEKIPIIFLSAHSEKEKLLEAIDLQVSSYIIKPFKIAKLKDIIFKTLSRIYDKDIRLSNNFIWNSNNSELYYKEILLSLTTNEVNLIKLLVKNRSRFLTVYDISLEVCCSNENSMINTNNIVQLISRLKNKIKKRISCDDFFIENTYGSGYKIK
ncbi:MAG: response regulator transcription factor [Campylobacterota bacterium]|nr:response regulator transcription factor [Campylobacterota bacterium]